MKTRKVKLKEKTLAVFMAVAMALTMMPGCLLSQTDDAYAATPASITAKVTYSGKTTLGATYSSHWYAYFDDTGANKHTAYCLQPTLDPDTTSGQKCSRMSNKSIKKAIYYCYDAYHDNGWKMGEKEIRKYSDTSTWSNYCNGGDIWDQYVYCHFLLSAIYNNPAGGWNDFINGSASSVVSSGKSAVLNNLPDVPEPVVSVKMDSSSDTEKCMWLKDQSGYRSPVYQLSATESSNGSYRIRNFGRITVPSGMSVHNESTGKTVTEGNSADIFSGEKFYFTMTDKHTEAIQVKGMQQLSNGNTVLDTIALNDYDVYLYNAGKGDQNIAFVDYDPVNTSVSLTFEPKGKLKWKKYYTTVYNPDTGLNETEIVRPEEGAEFQVWENGFSSYEEAAKSEFAYAETLKADADGNCVTGWLCKGTYSIKQVGGNKWNKYASPFTMTITEDGQTVTFSSGAVEDDLVQMHLQVIKRDRGTKKTVPVAGATFQILDSSKKPVSGKIYRNGRWTNADTFETEADGQFTFPDQLTAGTYYVHELKAPEGYVISDDVEFEISQNTKDNENIIVIDDAIAQLYFDDKPQVGRLIFSKYGRDVTFEGDESTESLAGVSFDIIAAEKVVTADGTVRYEEGDTVGSFTTGSDGKAEYAVTAETDYGKKYGEFKAIYIGSDEDGTTYRIVEKEMPEGLAEKYVMNDKGTEVTFTYAGQTLDFSEVETSMDNYGKPEIRTTALGKETEDHMTFAGETVIKDKVEYRNLIPGKEYKVSGILRDRESGEPVTDAKSGKEVMAEKTFTPEKAFGYVELEFTFDASALAGRTVVVFEDLDSDGKDVTEHADLDDEAQSVYIPKIGTAVSDSETGEHISNADADAKLVDTVRYENVIAGREYEITGVLMNRETGKPVTDAKGQKITASTKFTAEESSGSAEVVFAFDASKLAGVKTVVFETMTAGGAKVAEHCDLTDEGQEMDFPQLGTKAAAHGTDSITDTVAYKNLVPGKSYIIRGELMDKKTGKAIEGSQASQRFIPVAPDGTVKVVFRVDEKKLSGKDIVVFETGYLIISETAEDEKVTEKETEIAAHRDLKDKNQTVSFRTPQTGQSIPLYMLALLILAFVSGAAMVITAAAKRRKSSTTRHLG